MISSGDGGSGAAECKVSLQKEVSPVRRFHTVSSFERRQPVVLKQHVRHRSQLRIVREGQTLQYGLDFELTGEELVWLKPWIASGLRRYERSIGSAGTPP